MHGTEKVYFIEIPPVINNALASTSMALQRQGQELYCECNGFIKYSAVYMNRIADQ